MNWDDGYEGRHGVEAKGAFLKDFLKIAAERVPRTLILAVTIPDMATEMEPDSVVCGPRGVRLFATDDGIDWSEVALMLGFAHAQLDMIADYYGERYPPEFVEAVKSARRISGVSSNMKIAPTEWASGGVEVECGGDDGESADFL